MSNGLTAIKDNRASNREIERFNADSWRHGVSAPFFGNDGNTYFGNNHLPYYFFAGYTVISHSLPAIFAASTNQIELNKMGILTEEYNFFRFLYCQFENKSYICRQIRIIYRFIDILNSEAPCFILTKREPENFHYEGGEWRTVVSALTGADFCHIPPSSFSQDLRCRISARSLRLSV